MGKTAQDVLRQIKEEGIELIDLKFTDLHGKWQHLTVCADMVDASYDSTGSLTILKLAGEVSYQEPGLQAGKKRKGINPQYRRAERGSECSIIVFLAFAASIMTPGLTSDPAKEEI